MNSVSIDRTVRVLAVVVLYKQRMEQSTTLRALLPQRNSVAGLDIAFLLFDNGPDASVPPSLPPQVEYRAAERNEGLAGAYNAGLRRALEEGYDWLLTLDQDTDLPAHFLQAMRDAASQHASNLAIAAIVPHLVDAGRPVSPARVQFARITSMPIEFGGVPEGEARAFNSGALLRVAALEELGGFNPCFWLSFLDGWLHRALHRRGKRIFVLRDVCSEHKLSLLNYRERLSLAHFRNFLSAESAYHDLYCGWLEGALHTVRLGVRLINQRRRGEAPEVRLLTRACMLQRLTWPRARRLAQWRSEAGCSGQEASEG